MTIVIELAILGMAVSSTNTMLHTPSVVLIVDDGNSGNEMNCAKNNIAGS